MPGLGSRSRRATWLACRRAPGSLPPGLAHLDDFIASREVAYGLWFTGTAQVNPVFRADLEQVQADIARSLDTLLRN
jgi:hypothetical protein